MEEWCGGGGGDLWIHSVAFKISDSSSSLLSASGFDFLYLLFLTTLRRSSRCVMSVVIGVTQASLNNCYSSKGIFGKIIAVMMFLKVFPPFPFSLFFGLTSCVLPFCSCITWLVVLRPGKEGDMGLYVHRNH